MSNVTVNDFRKAGFFLCTGDCIINQNGVIDEFNPSNEYHKIFSFVDGTVIQSCAWREGYGKKPAGDNCMVEFEHKDGSTGTCEVSDLTWCDVVKWRPSLRYTYNKGMVGAMQKIAKLVDRTFAVDVGYNDLPGIVEKALGFDSECKSSLKHIDPNHAPISMCKECQRPITEGHDTCAEHAESTGSAFEISERDVVDAVEFETESAQVESLVGKEIAGWKNGDACIVTNDLGYEIYDCHEEFLGIEAEIRSLFKTRKGTEMAAVQHYNGSCVCWRLEMLSKPETTEQKAAERDERGKRLWELKCSVSHSISSLFAWSDMYEGTKEEWRKLAELVDIK